MWRREFLQALISPDPNQVQIEKARILKQNNLPASVFKLRTISEFSLANLNDDTVWVSGADEFNDPFDSAHSIRAAILLSSQPPEQVVKAFRATGALSGLSENDIQAIGNSADPIVDLFKLLGGGKSLGIKDSELHEVLHERASKFLNDRYQITVKKIQKAMKVSCFTTRNQSVVMWSHYADYHKGFSVEYDLQAHPTSPLAEQLWPVIYRRDFFDATPYLIRAVQGDNFNKLFGFVAALHKSPEWEYEDEWRVVLPIGWSQSSLNIQVPKPKAIYLGARISSGHESLIVNIAQRKSIPLFRMTMAPTEFSMIPQGVDRPGG